MKPLTLLRELIALPSINPAFLPDAPAITGEGQVAAYLGDIGKRAGLKVGFQEVFPGRRNVLITLPAAGRPEGRVLLAPHMDTVGVPDERLLSPRVKDGRVFGRGACDTKGSIAAMFSALLALAESKTRPRRTEITLAALVDEEDAQSGSRKLAATLEPAALAIVGEPTMLKVVTAHKGDMWLTLRARGKAAHGSKPELGRNAVLIMSRVVEALETSYARELRRRKHPLLGSPTINVGSIRGGTQANIVPDDCEILIDRRTIPGETEHMVCAEIRAFLKQHRLEARLENSKSNSCLPLQTNPKLPLVQAFLRHTRQRRSIGVDYFCDAAVIAATGTPCLVFGPGSISQAHTADEWLEIHQLEQAKQILLSFLQALP